jgi:hypothetical protein
MQRRHSKPFLKSIYHIFVEGTLSVCVCVRVCVSQLTIAESSGYYLCYSDPTDQGGHTEGLERQGLY